MYFAASDTLPFCFISYDLMNPSPFPCPINFAIILEIFLYEIPFFF